MTSELERQALLALRQLKAKLEEVQQRHNEPIAVVGIGCRFPGDARGPDEYWRFLRDGRTAVSEVPADRWLVAEHFDPDSAAVGKMNTRFGSFIQNATHFDAKHFGISDDEAAAMDPQHRLLLEVTYEALGDAGMAPLPRGAADTSTGVFLGIYYNDFLLGQTLRGDPARLTPYQTMGTLDSVAAGRLSFTFGFRGPSVALDSACSSSLLAVHLACNSLRLGECDSALAGGVNLILSPDAMIRLGKAQSLASDGRCRPFDAGATGIGRGEGCAMVVLKRLRDAQAQRNRIYAVILGSGVNQGGGSRYSLSSPNGSAITELMQQVSEKARNRPIGYVECHAVGTTLGDSQESGAVANFVAQSGQVERVAIGSCKANIGHLEPSAGIASFVKTVLSLHHREIPPQVNVAELNPYMQASDAKVVVSTERRPWPEGRCRAAVNAIGVGGTNAHVLLEATPDAPVKRGANAELPSTYVLPLSAKSEDDLRALARRYREHLIRFPADRLADLCHTAAAGRAHQTHRVAFVVTSREELAPMLESFENGKDHEGMWRGVVGDTPPKVAFLCTGQGAQASGMGGELYRTHPLVRERLEKCNDLLSSGRERSLLELFTGNDDDSTIDQTQYAQPALFSLECALIDLWRSWGVHPDAFVGHSVGEYAAAYGAGVFSLDVGLRLIAARGELIQGLPSGSMLAAAISRAEMDERLRELPGVSLAADNGPERLVFSGETGVLERLESQLRKDGRKVHRLSVSHAFHSSMMEPVLAPFEEVAASMEFAPPREPLVSNVSGTFWAEGEIPDAPYWRRHIREPVLFGKGLRALIDAGFDTFLEIGPQPVLLSLAKAQVSTPGACFLASLDGARSDWTSLLQSLAELYVRGVDIDWKKVNEPFDVSMISVPSYPLEPKPFPLPWGKVDGAAVEPSPSLANDADVSGFTSSVAWDVYAQDMCDGDTYLGSTRVSSDGRLRTVPVPSGKNWYVRHQSSAIDDASLASLLTEVARANIPGLSLASCTRLSANGFGELKAVPSLRTLDLFNTAIDDAGFSALGSLRELNALVLAATKVGDEGCKYISQLHRLERLHLGWTAISDAGVANLAGLSQLKTLVLRNTNPSAIALTHLAKMTQLRELNLCECPLDDEGLALLAPLAASLTRLDVSYTKLTSASVPLLLKFKALETLVLRGTPIDPKFDGQFRDALRRSGTSSSSRSLIR